MMVLVDTEFERLLSPDPYTYTLRYCLVRRGSFWQRHLRSMSVRQLQHDAPDPRQCESRTLDLMMTCSLPWLTMIRYLPPYLPKVLTPSSMRINTHDSGRTSLPDAPAGVRATGGTMPYRECPRAPPSLTASFQRLYELGNLSRSFVTPGRFHSRRDFLLLHRTCLPSLGTKLIQ